MRLTQKPQGDRPSAPLLILAAGQRCGSTLLQRLLSSHPDVLIWGEHVGQLRPVLEAGERLRTWSADAGQHGRLGYAYAGHQSFMANITPEAEHIDSAVRAFVETLFAEPARTAGRPVWGFKEVRYGLAEAVALRALFPDCRVVHIVRDPRDILRSLDVWERAEGPWQRYDTTVAIADWMRVGRSFWSPPGELPSWVLRLRYEDLIAEPSQWCARIGEHCGLDTGRFDTGVFDKRIHGIGLRGMSRRDLRSWADLPASLREVLDNDEVRLVAGACGYDLKT
jgi:Sulfotransferase family